MRLRSTSCITAAVVCVAAAAVIVPRAVAYEDAEYAARTAADIRGMPIERVERRPKIQIRGVITFRDFASEDRIFTVHDATGGTWVYAEPSVAEDVFRAMQVGTEIQGWGVLDPGGFAPLARLTEVRVLGRKPLPDPVPADIDRLFRGADNCERVSLTCVVQGFRRDAAGRCHLVVASDYRRFLVRVPCEVVEPGHERLVDATVAVIGIVSAARNTRGEFLSPGLNVAGAADLTVVKAPSGEPFDAPSISLERIARFRPEPTPGQRIRIEGTVTLMYPEGFVYLQNGLAGVRVQTRDRTPMRAGDRVEAAGFLDMSRQIGSLCESKLRVVRHGEPVRPVKIQPNAIVAINVAARRSGEIAKPSTYDGCLVECQATHVESHSPQDGWCNLTLADGPLIFTALLPEDQFPLIRGIQPGSSLRIRGVPILKSSSGEGFFIERGPSQDNIDFLLQSATDLVVVGRPSWWTSRRLAVALVAALGGLVAALGFIELLRRQVARQAGRLAEEIRSRREADVESQAALKERSRLATNLHDTVLQTVTGINFQLQACRTVNSQADSDTAGHFTVAERMVEHAIQQLRGTVWALHALPMSDKSLPVALAALGERIGEGQAVRIKCRTSGEEFNVPEHIAGQLLLVAQEAIRNALHHAKTSTVTVSTEFLKDGSIVVTISDDGVGFLMTDHPGATQGHFGLEGMRDRMQRIGGQLAVISAPGSGTVVTATVTVVGVAADLSGRPVSEPAAKT